MREVEKGNRERGRHKYGGAREEERWREIVRGLEGCEREREGGLEREEERGRDRWMDLEGEIGRE